MSGRSDEPIWRKSSYSGTSGCVEVAVVGDQVLIRDTKNRDAGHLTVSRECWNNFLDAVRNGL
ncbi:DUF397 domain-containing protein [Actinoplanes sp. NPDC004185]